MINSVVRFFGIAAVLLIPVAVNAATDAVLTVLDKKDKLPPDAVQISSQAFTGNDPAQDCSYYELLEKAKEEGRKLGANVMKINNRRERTREQFCDEINVSYYKAADIKDYEKRFSWTAERPLEWQDFKGPVPAGAAPRNAAVTSCGIAIETSTTTDKIPGRVYVYNSFETNTSWVKPEQRKADVLQHEQGHFDLCELYTRIMRARFSKASINVKNLQSVVKDIYGKTMQEYAERQQKYDSETQHGILAEEQSRWLTMIARELADTVAWTSK